LPWVLFALVLGLLVGGLIGVRGGWTFRAFLYPYHVDTPDLNEVLEASAPFSEETPPSESKIDVVSLTFALPEKDTNLIQSAGARAAIAAARRRRPLTE
jgi:hypothetical protein